MGVFFALICDISQTKEGYVDALLFLVVCDFRPKYSSLLVTVFVPVSWTFYVRAQKILLSIKPTGNVIKGLPNPLGKIKRADFVSEDTRSFFFFLLIQIP